MKREIIAVRYKTSDYTDSRWISEVKLADQTIVPAEKVIAESDYYYTTSDNTKADIITSVVPFDTLRRSFDGQLEVKCFKTKGNNTEEDNLSELPEF